MKKIIVFFLLIQSRSLTFWAAPMIESLSRKTASIGTLVTIYGSEFGTEQGQVVLTGLQIEPNSWSPERVTFRVPEDGASGSVRIRHPENGLSNEADFTVERSLPDGQFEPFGLQLMETGMSGAAFLVEMDGSFLYGITGFETLSTYKIHEDAPYELCSRTYLKQRVGDIRLHKGFLFCVGDHGLLIYRCKDLQEGKTKEIAAVAGTSFMGVDIKEKSGDPIEGTLVALCEYRPRSGSATLNVFLYKFLSEELINLGFFERTVDETERQHAIAIDPLNAKVYVSGYKTLFADGKFLLELDISQPEMPVLNHREETGKVLFFDMATIENLLWTGIVATGTEVFRVYELNHGNSHLTLKQSIESTFQFGKTTRIDIIDEQMAAGAAWLGARPDVFLLNALQNDTMPAASANSIDWAFDVAGFAEPSGEGKIIVADEWGGFMTFDVSKNSENEITHAHDYHMVATTAMTEGLHLTDDRIYIANRGAGVWSADRFDLADASSWKRVPWNWSEEKTQPHPISAVCTRKDPDHGMLIAALGHDKAMAWGTEIYGLLYKETDDCISQLAASEPIIPPGLYSSGVSVIWPERDLVFMTTGTDGFRAYIVNPDKPEISLHINCQLEGFCSDLFSSSNMAICMEYCAQDDDRLIIIGTKPALFVADPTLYVFTVEYPDGVPDRYHPERPIVIQKKYGLNCLKTKTVNHLRIHPNGTIAAATNQGLVVFHHTWIPDLNTIFDFQAWNKINIPNSVFEPWWANNWNKAFNDVSFGGNNTIYGVKSPQGIWKIELTVDEENMDHASQATAYYPGVQCGMDYQQMLLGWGNPDITTLHHPYGVAASGDTVYVTGWSGKVERLCFSSNNMPPGVTTIQGPEMVNKGANSLFTFISHDTDHDQIYFYVKWGDGVEEQWIGPYPAEEEVILQHTWTETGHYEVRVSTRDAGLLQGPWESLKVRVEQACGDCNNDGGVDLSDAVTILQYLFMGLDLPVELDVADLNSDNNLDISDVVYLLQYLFAGPIELCPDRTK